MNKTTNHIILYTLVILNLIASAILYLNYNGDKTAYIDVNKVYEGFEMKKEIEIKYLKQDEIMQNMSDSLKIVVLSIERKINSNVILSRNEKAEILKQRETYLKKIKDIEEKREKIVNNYDKQIYTQLIQYIKDYGDEKGYDYIFGTDGSNSVLYSSYRKNITQDMLLYINKRHKGQ